MKPKNPPKISVCLDCRIIYRAQPEFCSRCGNKVTKPEINDDFLKKFLEVDDKILSRFKEIRNYTIEEAKSLLKRDEKINVLGISGSARDEFDMAQQSSNSEFLLKSALAKLESLGAKTELIELRNYDIKPCKACYSTTNTQCHFYCSCYAKGTPLEDDMTRILYDKVLLADIILFATPVNNFKMSSFMALFIDRCISLDGSLKPADPGKPKDKELNIKHTQFVELMADQKIHGSGFLRRFEGKVAGILVTGHEEGAALVISSLFMTLNHFGMVFPPWSNLYAMSSLTNPTFRDKEIVNSRLYIEEAEELAENTFIAATNLRKKESLIWKYDQSSN